MTLERTAPQDLAAERAVLGGVLVSPGLLESVEWLAPEAFFRAVHGDVWRAMLALAEQGRQVDMLLLTSELRRQERLDAVGGPGYLAGLVDGVPRSSNVPYYAQLVQAKADLRVALGQVETLKRELEEDQEDVPARIAEAQATLETLAASRTGLSGMRAAEQLDTWGGYLDRVRTGPRIELGLPTIDREIGGISPGEVVGIMARPGLGKTLLLCHLASGLTGLGHLCCSLEMPAPQIVERLMRMVTRYGKWQLRGLYERAELDTTPYMATFGDLVLEATPNLSVADIARRTKAWQREQAIRVVSIDHLGLIGGDPKLTTYDRVSKQARELKDLAKRHDVVVVIVIQANRDSGGDGARELHLGSARDSGVVEEACDYIIAMRRLDRSTTLEASERSRYRDVLFAKLLKHRHGIPMTDEVAYRIDGDSLRLDEDRDLKPEENTLRRLAAVGGRR